MKNPLKALVDMHMQAGKPCEAEDDQVQLLNPLLVGGTGEIPINPIKQRLDAIEKQIAEINQWIEDTENGIRERAERR